MFVNAVVASTALFAAFARAQLGQATVVNECGQTVYLANTPSYDGVHQTQFATLQTGESYSQTYTQLNNDNGWSLKLGFLPDLPDGSIMQYEYTYQGNGIVWFDLSKVNGNPFNNYWNISSSDADTSCAVSQKAYMFPSDNTAMQPSCNADTDVTVTLCQWPSALIASENGGTWGSAISSVIADILPSSTSTEEAPVPTTTSTPEPTTTTPAPVTTTTTPPPPVVPSPSSTSEVHNPVSFEGPGGDGPGIPAFTGAAHNFNNADNAAVSTSGTPTTLETSTITSAAATLLDSDGSFEVVWVTDVVTEHVTLTTTAEVPEETGLFQRHAHAHVRGHAHGH